MPVISRWMARIFDSTSRGELAGTFINTAIGQGDDLATEWMRSCLSGNWSRCQTYGLLTPENVTKLNAGDAPVGTAGEALDQPMTIMRRGNGNGAALWLEPKTRANYLQAEDRRATSPDPGQPPRPRGNVIKPGTAQAAQTKSGTANPKVTTVDTPLGKQASLAPYGLRNLDVVVWTADSTTGIHFSVIDSSQTVRKRIWDDYGNAYYKDYPVSDRKTIPYSGQPIAGTAESGVLVVEQRGVKVYILTGMGIPNNSFRLLIAR